MAIEVITLSISPEQNIDSCLAFAKGLLTRKIAAGAIKDSGKVKIFMLPASAARYATGHPTFLEDRDAVIAAIKAAGYVMNDGIGSPLDGPPVEEPKAPAPAPAPKVKLVKPVA